MNAIRLFVNRCVQGQDWTLNLKLVLLLLFFPHKCVKENGGKKLAKTIF